MPKRVYIETTIPSYLAAWPSRDLRQAARQQLTHDWWDTQRAKYDLLISQFVLDEAAAGDPGAAARRLSVLQNLLLLQATAEVHELAAKLIDPALLPTVAGRDAVHISIAAIHGVDFLLTWNCRHIANATIMKELAATVSAAGFELPTICTPEELFGE
jgi:hypothetical protein